MTPRPFGRPFPGSPPHKLALELGECLGQARASDKRAAGRRGRPQRLRREEPLLPDAASLLAGNDTSPKTARPLKSRLDQDTLSSGYAPNSTCPSSGSWHGPWRRSGNQGARAAHRPGRDPRRPPRGPARLGRPHPLPRPRLPASSRAMPHQETHAAPGCYKIPRVLALNEMLVRPANTASTERTFCSNQPYSKEPTPRPFSASRRRWISARSWGRPSVPFPLAQPLFEDHPGDPGLDFHPVLSDSESMSRALHRTAPREPAAPSPIDGGACAPSLQRYAVAGGESGQRLDLCGVLRKHGAKGCPASGSSSPSSCHTKRVPRFLRWFSGPLQGCRS